MPDADVINLLLIEENLADAVLIQNMLQDARHPYAYKLKHFTSLKAALRYYRAHNAVDVILSDFMLPDARGDEAIHQLSKLASQTPVVIITGSQDDLAINAIQGGAQDYLLKGEFDAAVLARVIRYAIERKKIEQSLHQTEERLRVVIDNAASCLFMMDEHGIATFMNPAAERETGYTIDEMRQKTLHEYIHYQRPDGTPLPPEECAMSLAFGTDQTVRGEDTFIRKDGSFCQVSYSMAPLAREGRIIGAVLEFQDITERKALERQKDDFIGIASHELKTPVTSIKAYGQVLRMRFRRAGDESSATLIGKMDAQLNKLTYLINDLLDITKIESGKLQFHKTYFDFNDLIEEVVEEVQHTTDRHTIFMDLAVSKKLYADRYRIAQVIINLLTNAIKYSPQADKIVLSTKSYSDYVLASIQDFGVGIPDSKLSKVFERFFRVSGPTQGTYPGLGLGLYISSEIVLRHHGKIWVESEEGKGSTFFFTLPVKYKPKSRRREAESTYAG